ncbi:MAG TPA: hypothetical protein VER96_00895 [Polyangiaceae bacterium]|nr:hypothetical protein [Polyangiaceae bacterium]
MKPSHSSMPPARPMAAYLEGDLGALDAQLFELLNTDHQFDDVDLVPSIRARIRERRAAQVRPCESVIERWMRRPVAALFATGLVAAAVCLGIALKPRGHAADEYRSKSAGETLNPARWAGVHAYRVHAGKSEPLAESLARGDGLLFSYTNLGGAPLQNLMIFAVDSNHEVHWFHPAYEREGENPSSIVIDRDAAQTPLAELIQDEYPTGALSIHALFSNRPLHVLEVEAWLKDDPRVRLEEKEPGSVEQVLTTRVER